MSYEIKGTIKSISEIAEAGQGKKLSFRINTEDQYNPIAEFEMYKGADYTEHLDNFIKYNKVGDSVLVEFNLKTFNWKPEADDKIFTSLSCWKVEKLNDSAPIPTSEPQVESGGDTQDELPF
jgi:hypothetical protein